ncbi:hypothetical protein EWI07_03920 [Sporolactobacillus sp. THM7-4]|nr:hypothetical protein EWI07_03920 [Sporolactobacillus sp. THM7-4]
MDKRRVFLIPVLLAAFALIFAFSMIQIGKGHSPKNAQLLFNMKEQANQQGLTWHDGIYYVGFDVGDHQGMIVAYDRNGHEVGRTSKMNIGHTAGLDYFDGKIYVANGGNELSKIYITDFKTSKIVRTIDVRSYGDGALIAVKNKKVMILHTTLHLGQDVDVFSFIDENGKKLKSFTLKGLGTPQGLDYQNGKIYYYTNNLITMINEKGEIIKKIPLKDIHGESEGLTLADGKLVVGYNHNNRLYLIKQKSH